VVNAKNIVVRNLSETVSERGFSAAFYARQEERPEHLFPASPPENTT
jgi:hypothetical protein